MTEETNVSTQSAENAPPQTSNAEQQSFAIPEAYAERGWAKDIRSADDLWKLTDNAQSLIGKRPAGIPTKDAPQEEWDKFYRSMGRPDSADQYEFDASYDGMPEGVDMKAYEEKAKGFFHKLGLSPEKANEAWKEYVAMEMEGVEAHKASLAEREAEADKKFDEIGGKLYGDKFNAVSQEAKDYIAEILPDELKGSVEKMAGEPEVLLALISIAHESKNRIRQVEKEFGKEDTLSSGSQSAGESMHELQQRLIAAKEKWNKAGVFSPERKSAEDEIGELRGRISKLAK